MRTIARTLDRLEAAFTKSDAVAKDDVLPYYSYNYFGRNFTRPGGRSSMTLEAFAELLPSLHTYRSQLTVHTSIVPLTAPRPQTIVMRSDVGATFAFDVGQVVREIGSDAIAMHADLWENLRAIENGFLGDLIADGPRRFDERPSATWQLRGLYYVGSDNTWCPRFERLGALNPGESQRATSFCLRDQAEAQGSPVLFSLLSVAPKSNERGDVYFSEYVRDTLDLAALCDPALPAN